MSQLIKRNGAELAHTSAVHLEFIQNQLGRPEAEGLAEIEAYHRAVFLHHHGGELEKYQQQARVHEERLAPLENRLRDAHGKLAGIEKSIPASFNGEPDVKPPLPWNAWDVGMFAAAAIGILGLLIFGVLNISFNLLESGLITFVESPVRAYFWAALLPVGALGVKIGWDFLEQQKARTIYLWSCLTLGLIAVIVWVGAYALVYPTMSRSISEHIQTLSVHDTQSPAGALSAINGTGTKVVDVVTVAAQAIAEIFLSAVLGMTMTSIYSRHRPVRLAFNPLFTHLDAERQALEQTVQSERMLLAQARGEQSRLENQLNALVAYAKSLFQKESALRRDQAHQRQNLLNQLSETLRTQLETISNGSYNRNHALSNKEEAQ